jgi:tetratricopeptide (TPR) repeat protein
LRDRNFFDDRFFKHRVFRDDFHNRRFFRNDLFFHHDPFFFNHRFFHHDPFFFNHGRFHDDLIFDDIGLLNSFCRARDFFFFVNLGSYVDRGVPDYVYETQQRYEDTPVDVRESDDPLARAYSAFAKGDYGQSIDEFSKALAANPDDGLIYLARAQAYIAIGDYGAANGDIREGMRVIPDWPDVAINLKKLYSAPQDFASHLNRLENWVRERPEDTGACFVLGYVYYFTQNYERAKAQFIHTLNAEPGHREADLLLKAIYEREAVAAEQRKAPKAKAIEKKAAEEKAAEKRAIEKNAVKENAS